MSFLFLLNAEEKVSEWEVIDQNVLENALLARTQAKDEVWCLLDDFVQDLITFQNLFEPVHISHLGQN